MKYYVNEKAQSNGDHEVHTEYCQYLLIVKNKKYLGEFSTCSAAVTAAKWFYPTADGCKICSASCNSR